MSKTSKELTEMATRWQQAPGKDEFFSLGEITSFCDHFAVGIQRLIKEVGATEFNYQKLLEELLDVKEAGRRRAEFWEDQINTHAEWRDRVASICEFILPRVIDDGDQCSECLDELRALLHFRDKTNPRDLSFLQWKDVEKDGVPEHGGLVLVAGGMAFYGDASQAWKSGNGPDYGRVLEWQVRYWAELPAPPIK